MDAPLALKVTALVGVTLLPLLALAGAVAAVGSRHRRLSPALAALALALTYLHPLVQEAINQAYLAPKLERARAMVGQPIPNLVAHIGEPSRVVPDPSPSPQRYGYLRYDAAPWTPFAQTELIVPTSDDGRRVSMISHYAD